MSARFAKIILLNFRFVFYENKPNDPSDINAQLQELRVINDEFLLTIAHQSETMAQLQKICGELQKEKEDQEATIMDLEKTIAKQSQVNHRFFL